MTSCRPALWSPPGQCSAALPVGFGFFVLGLIVWEWANSEHSLDSNQECGIGFENSPGSLSNFFGLLKERKPQKFRGFTQLKPSRGTNLLVLIILAGDIEMNPGPRSQCRHCKKYCKVTDKIVKCQECSKCFRESCTNLSEKELLELGSENETWYCKAECGLCSGDVLNNHEAVQSVKCEMWVRNDCSFITDFQYETKQNSSSTWICPKCDFFNFSDSFFSEQLNLEDQNRFSSLAKDSKTITPSTGRKNSKFVSGLKFSSINVNGIRSKKLELSPSTTDCSNSTNKIDSSISTSELFQETCPYNAYRKDRNSKGGGVMLLIHKDISHMPITELENDSESVWVKVFTNKTSHFVVSWYQPPGRNLAELTLEIDLLRSQLQKIKCMHKGNKPPSVHVLGDSNFGDIVWPDRLNKSGSPLSPSEGEILIEIMNDYGLEQLVHFPTRERNTLDHYENTPM